MAVKEMFFDLLHAVGKISNEDWLSTKPLAREYLQSEHRALERLFGEIGDAVLSREISDTAERKYKQYQEEGLIPSGQEGRYKTLARGTAMRIVWGYKSGLTEELDTRYAVLFKEQMQILNAWEKFNRIYVNRKTGKSSFASFIPTKPYF